jgi:hypothetical protein
MKYFNEEIKRTFLSYLQYSKFSMYFWDADSETYEVKPYTGDKTLLYTISKPLSTESYAGIYNDFETETFV